jgi:hypothetical protein
MVEDAGLPEQGARVGATGAGEARLEVSRVAVATI